MLSSYVNLTPFVKVRVAYPILTFSKGEQKCVKKYVQVKLGIRSEQIPHSRGSKQALRDSKEKSQRGCGSGPQSGCQGLFCYRPGSINRLEGDGNCPAEVQRRLSQGTYVYAACQEGKGRQKESGSFQRGFQTPLRRVHSVEAIRWRTYWSGRFSNPIQQHQHSHDDTGPGEGIQTNRCQSRSSEALLHPLPQAYLRVRALPGQRLQPASGPEAAGTRPHRDHSGLRRHNGTRYAASFEEALCLRVSEYLHRRPPKLDQLILWLSIRKRCKNASCNIPVQIGSIKTMSVRCKC